jgi:hypothetical protein
MQLTSRGTPAPDDRAPRLGHALGESKLLGSLHMALSSSNPLLVVLQPIEQGPGHGAVRVEVDLPSPEAGTCAQHKRPGF